MIWTRVQIILLLRGVTIRIETFLFWRLDNAEPDDWECKNRHANSEHSEGDAPVEGEHEPGE